MILDHANRYLSWDQAWIEQAGRAVFPLFAIVLGMGLRGVGGRARARRLVAPLVVFGVVAQVALLGLVWAGMRDVSDLNVLFTLAMGSLLVSVWDRDFVRHWAGMLAFAAALMTACVSEYGPIGALLVLAAALGSRWLLWTCLALLSVSQHTIVPLAVPFFVWALDRGLEGETFRSPRKLFAIGYVVQYAIFSAFVGASAIG